MSDLAKMQEKASDPNTPLTTLQAIAQDYPALRPALALNPSTYPDLLDWLRSLEDPEIDNALAKRAEAEKLRQQMSQSPDKVGSKSSEMISSSPASSAAESNAEEVSAAAGSSAEAEAIAGKAGVAGRSTSKALKPAKPASHFAKPRAAAEETEEEELSPAAIAAAGLAASAATAATGSDSEMGLAANSSNAYPTAGTGLGSVSRGRWGSADTAYQGASPHESQAVRKPNRTWMWMLLGLVAMILIVVVTIVNMNGSKPENVASIPAEDPMPITTGASGAVTMGPDGKPTESSPLPSLPAGYTGPTKTIEVPGPTPGETLLVVVPDTDAPNAPSTASPSADPKNPLAAPANAKKVRSFTTADGNIRCVFADTQVQCFANVLNAATNCETRQGDTGYTLTLTNTNTLQADCIAPQNMPTESSLGANEAAASSGFACKNSAGGNTVMCWDTKDGDGFVLGNSTLNRFNTGDALPKFQ